MTRRPLDGTQARLLNHVEFFYAPGERALARRLFEALGFRVLDPQVDPTPPELGPAAGPYLIVHLDPEDGDLIDNVAYASEASEAQWRFESALSERIEADPALGALRDEMRAAFSRLPQAMTHVGVAYPDADQVKGAMERLASIPELADRVTLSDVFMPGEPGSVDDRVVQAFVYTDVIAVGLLTGGQQIELQARLDGV